MKFLYMVDERILDYIERFCHSVQRTIGMTNFDIARYSTLVGIMCDIAFNLFVCKPSNLGSLFMALVFFVYLLYAISYVEKSVGGGIKSGCANVFRIYWQVTRIGFALLVLVSSGVDVGTFLIIGKMESVLMTVFCMFVCLTFYLMSCTPLPPAPSRLSEFFSKLKVAPLPEVRPSES